MTRTAQKYLCIYLSTYICIFLFYLYLYPFFTAELKSALFNFAERETTLDYDREAEQALQRLTTGDADVNQLTDAWARSYVEVMWSVFM